jgi:biopolymer transport protein ExbB/TolQ
MNSTCGINPGRDAGEADDARRGGSGSAGRERHMVIGIWALAVFTAFLFGSTIVHVIIMKRAYEGTKAQIEAIRSLNESVKEIRKSISELSAIIREAQEAEREEQEQEPLQIPYLGDGKV